jgi:predicted metal-binding membrane protein
MKEKPIMFRWMINPYVNFQHWVGYGSNRTACGITLSSSGLGGWATIDGECIPKCKKCMDIEKQNTALRINDDEKPTK